ncbi:MAG: methyltransferase domain-containing protein [Anaerolinea sp.]|nr:methyltransferase domain-containing protein [Anaerolinea sp.]
MHDPKHPHDHAVPETQGRTIRWAGHYDLVVKLLTLGREKTLRGETIRQAAIRPGAAVLDVGCGTGTLTLLAKATAGQAGQVYGIDAAPEMIAAARQKAAQQGLSIDFQTGLIEALPFADATFDVVLSSLMFHHLPPELKQRGLAEIYRVLKPRGRLVIVDMLRPVTLMQHFTLATFVHHAASHDVYDLLPLMEQIGFEDRQSGTMSWRVLGFAQGSRPQ